MADAPCELLIEARLPPRPGQVRTLTVDGPEYDAEQLWSFSLQTAGGGLRCRDFAGEAAEDRCISWQVENAATGTLRLTEARQEQGGVETQLEIDLPAQALQGIACCADSQRAYLVALLSTGHIARVELLLGSDGLLGSVQASSVTLVDVSRRLLAVGTPSSIAGVKDTVCIGGSNGVIVCLPATVHADDARVYELRCSSWGLQRLISGVWQKPRQPALVSCLPFTTSAEQYKHVLLGLYDDCTLRAFSTLNASQLHGETLDADAAARQLTPIFATLCPVSSATGDQQVLVVQYESKDLLTRTTVAYVLQATGSGRPHTASRTELRIPVANASIVGAQVCQGALWLLVNAQGCPQLLGHALADGQVQACALLEEATASRQLGADAGDTVAGHMWSRVLEAFPGCVSPAEQVLGELLAPGRLCRASLRDALALHGASLSLPEAEAATLQQLRTHISTTEAILQARSPGSPHHATWLTILASYRAAWARRHAALGLVSHPGGKLLMCVRGGHALTVLRPAAAAEALLHSRLLPRAPSPIALPAAHQAVHHLLGEMEGLLGSGALHACWRLLAAGVDAAGVAALHLAGLLLSGPSPDAEEHISDSVRQQMVAWRMRRQRWLISLGTQLGSLAQPMQAVSDYCAHALLHKARPAQAASGRAGDSAAGAQSASAPVAGLLCDVVGAVAQAQSALLRNALVLAAVVRQLGGCGPEALPAADLGALETHLMPGIATELRRAAIAAWLTSTAATAAQPPTGAAAAAAAQPPGVTLASKLLPSLRQLLGGVADVAGGQDGGSSARVLVVIKYGPADGGPAEQAPSSLPGRALELGYALFQQGEHLPLATLVNLAAGSAMAAGSQLSPGIDFLRGLSLACQAEAAAAEAAGPEQLQRQQLLTAACSSFFRAAASGLAGPEGAPLRAILQHMSYSMLGGQDNGDGGARLQGALLQLRYLEVVMVLLEVRGAPEGAAQFARAAIELALSAYGGSSSGAQEGQQHVGRLWARLFGYCCTLRAFEDAYAAALSNPVADLQLDCLRRLVLRLAEEGEAAVLCSLPFAGSVHVAGSDGRVAAVPVYKEAVATLLRHAHMSAVTARPCRWQLLHALLASRCDHASAAKAMVAKARRLRLGGERTRETAEAALRAYEAALAALDLVEPEQAFLDLEEDWLRPVAAPQAGGRELLFARGGSGGGEGGMAVDGGGVGGHGGGPQAQYLTRRQLVAEYVVLKSAARVAEAVPGMDPLGQWSGMPDVFQQLLLLGRYDDALALAHACSSAAQLTAALERALGSLAGCCVQAQLASSGGAVAAASGAAESAGGGRAAAAAWSQLRRLLKLYSSGGIVGGAAADSQRGPRLVLAVADAVLKADRRMALPHWLMQMFGPPPAAAVAAAGAQPQYQGMAAGPAADPAALLSLFMQHSRLGDAVQLVAQHVQRWNKTMPFDRQRASAVWLPHQRIQALRSMLKEEADAGSAARWAVASGSTTFSAGQLLQQLHSALEAHLQLLEHDNPLPMLQSMSVVSARPPQLVGM